MGNMTRICLLWLAAGVLVVVGVLGGCGGSDGGVTPTGTLRVALTDAPDDQIAELHVHITSIQLSNRAEAAIVLLSDRDIPDDIDLVGLEDNPLMLGDVNVRVGRYSEIRVLLADEPGSHWLRLADGTVHPVALREGDVEGGTRLVEPFELPAGQAMTLLIDFMAAPSVYPRTQGDEWEMQPMIFAQGVDGANPNYARITGTVRDRGGQALEAPPGQIVGVFIQNQIGELVAVADVTGTPGPFTVPRVVPGRYALKVRYTTALWEPQSDPLPLVVGAQVQNFVQVRTQPGGQSAPNIVVDQ